MVYASGSACSLKKGCWLSLQYWVQSTSKSGQSPGLDQWVNCWNLLRMIPLQNVRSPLLCEKIMNLGGFYCWISLACDSFPSVQFQWTMGIQFLTGSYAVDWSTSQPIPPKWIHMFGCPANNTAINHIMTVSSFTLHIMKRSLVPQSFGKMQPGKMQPTTTYRCKTYDIKWTQTWKLSKTKTIIDGSINSEKVRIDHLSKIILVYKWFNWWTGH